MLSDFLKERMQVHCNYLEEYMHNLDDLLIEKNETKRFIKILDETSDKSLSVFSPYNNSAENFSKIKELKSKLHVIDEDIKKYNIMIIEEKNLIEKYKKCIIEAIELEKK